MDDPTRIKPRLTVTENVYHQVPSEMPESVVSTFSRQLESHEQVYTRKLTATEGWQPLIGDECWLKECSLIHISNEEGKRLQANPTEEERAAIDAKVLEIGDGEVDNWLVPPGETFRGMPTVPSSLEIRSRSGPARFTLTVFPK